MYPFSSLFFLIALQFILPRYLIPTVKLLSPKASKCPLPTLSRSSTHPTSIEPTLYSRVFRLLMVRRTASTMYIRNLPQLSVVIQGMCRHSVSWCFANRYPLAIAHLAWKRPFTQYDISSYIILYPLRVISKQPWSKTTCYSLQYYLPAE